MLIYFNKDKVKIETKDKNDKAETKKMERVVKSKFDKFRTRIKSRIKTRPAVSNISENLKDIVLKNQIKSVDNIEKSFILEQDGKEYYIGFSSVKIVFSNGGEGSFIDLSADREVEVQGQYNADKDPLRVTAKKITITSLVGE